MSLVIGLDLGSTNCKAVALSPAGEIVGIASKAYPWQTRQPNWAEQDANDIWSGAAGALRDLVAQVPPGQLSGLCLSGAMHSLLLLDPAGNPLAPATTWADQRCIPQAKALRERIDPHPLYLRTGCPLQPVYHLPKLQWWREAEPQTWSRAARFISLKDWVLHQLTGAWATDIGLASSTGLLDIHRLVWDAQALGLVELSADRLLSLVSPSSIAGNITRQASKETGLPQGLPVIAGTSDGGLANLGAGAYLPGQAVITVGTTGAIRHILDRPLTDPRERTWCYIFGEQTWFRGGTTSNGGITLQWVRQQFYPELQDGSGYESILSEAESIPPGAGGLFFLPYFAGERSPHWDAEARAMIYGLGLEHTRTHIARAALEGVAFCLADIWEALSEGFRLEQPVYLTGGITRAPTWAQIVCDIIGVPMLACEAADASAVGAAILGHAAMGIAPLEELAKKIRTGSLIHPDPARHRFYSEQHRVFQELFLRTKRVTK